MAKFKININKSIILALLPFAGYFAAYNYEKGYISFFKIPPLFIRLGLEEILTATSALMIGVFSIYLFLSVIFPFKKLVNIQTAIGRTVIKVVLMFSIMIFPLVIIFGSASPLDKLFISLAALLFLIIYEFGFAIFRKGKILEEKLIKEEKSERRVERLENLIARHPQFLTILIIFMAFGFIYLLASSAGERDAKWEKSFLIITDQNEKYVVVRSYPNEKIVVAIDDTTKIIKNHYKFINSDKEISGYIDKVGPLKNGLEKKSITVSLKNWASVHLNNLIKRLRK